MNELIENVLNGDKTLTEFKNSLSRFKKKKLNEECTFNEVDPRNAEILSRRCTPLEFLCVAKNLRNKQNKDLRTELVSALLEAGAEHSAGAHHPLLIAAFNGHYPIVELLIARGAKVNLAGSLDIEMEIMQQCTPLMAASFCGHMGVMGLCLKHQALIKNAECPISAVSTAILGNQKNAFLFLLNFIKQNPSVYSKDHLFRDYDVARINNADNFKTPLRELLLSKQLTIDDAKAILTYAINNRDELLLTGILNTKLVGPNELLSLPVAANVTIKSTALHISALMGSGNLIAILINQFKANLNCFDEMGFTPFSIAIANQQLKIVQLMLNSIPQDQRKSFVNFYNQDKSKNPPLLIAISYQKSYDYEIVKLLLENGADPLAKNDNGQTPFTEVISRGYAPLLELFKEHGVNLDAPTSFIYNNGPHVHRPIYAAIRLNHRELIHELCKQGVRLTCVDDERFSPLLWATQDPKDLSLARTLIEEWHVPVDEIMSGGVRLIRFHIEKDNPLQFDFIVKHSQVNLIEGESYSPLEVAARTGRLHYIKKLLDRGATPTSETLTHLLRSQYLDSDGYESISSLINHAKFDVNSYCKECINPLFFAIEHDDTTLTEILLPRFTLFDEDIHENALIYAIILNRLDVLKVIFKYLLANELLWESAEHYLELGFSLLANMNLQEVSENVRALYAHVWKPQNSSAQSITTISPQGAFFKAGTSAHAYLRHELQWSNDDISALQELTQFTRKPVRNKTSQDTPEEFTWFNNQIHSSSIQAIEGNTLANFLWLADDELINQGCELNDFKKDRFTFSDQCVKRLSDSKYTRTFEINGKICNSTATHELKIKKSSDRILLFPFRSDNTLAILYIGAVFQKHGFHTAKDKKDLSVDYSERMSIIEISLPETLKQAESALQEFK